MKLTNYYQLLNIDSSADLDAIKKAFRTEIALYHPDNNKSEGAKARFESLVEGFEILSHPTKREAYDAMLHATETNKPILIEPKAEEQYKEWKREAKKKSETYWDGTLAELLVLDIFLEAGFTGLFSEPTTYLTDLAIR